jgi:hypothetical protein
LVAATSPFTVVLPASSLQELSETGPALMAASFPLGEPKPLQPNLCRAVRLDTAFILIQLVLVLPVIALDDRDLLVSQTGNPADDPVVRAPVLKVWNQVVNRNPAGGELEPSAPIDQNDLVLHTVALLSDEPPGRARKFKQDHLTVVSLYQIWS